MCTADLVIESRSLIWWRLTRIAFCSPSILGCCWPLPPTALRRGCKGRSLKILAASNFGPRFCKNMVSDPPPTHTFLKQPFFTDFKKYTHTPPPKGRNFGALDQKFRKPPKSKQYHNARQENFGDQSQISQILKIPVQRNQWTEPTRQKLRGNIQSSQFTSDPSTDTSGLVPLQAFPQIPNIARKGKALQLLKRLADHNDWSKKYKRLWR